MGSEPLTLRYLTLQPTPLADAPEPGDSDFEHNLVEEARTLLESDLWTGKKDWHGGIVSTFDLPTGKVTYDPRVPNARKGESPTGEAGGEGILWHKRVSRFKASEHGDYETWWAAMGANHVAQEEEYVDSLVQVVDVGKEEDKPACYCKLFKLPFGATDRSFLVQSVVLGSQSTAEEGEEEGKEGGANKSEEKSDNKKKEKKGKDDDADENGDEPDPDAPPGSKDKGPREFMVFSLPFTTDREIKEEKKYVRGTQVTVERIREVEGGEIEWSNASLSTPGGNLPVKMVEGKMAQNLADAVPAILTWMNKKYPPSASGVKNGTYTADSEATARNPVPVRTTDTSEHPGGSHGRMPAMASQGTWTVEMFQQPVHLREF